MRVWYIAVSEVTLHDVLFKFGSDVNCSDMVTGTGVVWVFCGGGHVAVGAFCLALTSSLTILSWLKLSRTILNWSAGARLHRTCI